MTNEFEDHLNELAKKNPKVKVLINQWGLERPLLEKALTGIPKVFEHYSLHDATHSDKILEKIGRLLGSVAISKLSATDTWLLLESAYWHDVGMLVSTKDIHNTENDSEFKAYIKEIITGKDNELKSAAKCIFNEDGSFLPVKMTEENDNKRKQIIANYFRPKHPSRSAEIIQLSHEDYGIKISRPPEIEFRVIEILAKICKMHGEPFSEIVNNLPQEQDGLASDSFHPMFLACLLRIGDLLDLDNNRFSPTQAALSGKPPASKQLHIDKHRSIREFLVTPEKIAIVAAPEYPAVETIIDEWFKMIKEEIDNLYKYKSTIVPTNLIKYIPVPHLDLRDKPIDDTNPKIDSVPVPSNNMITIKGGTFIMGSPIDEAQRRDNETQHQETVSTFMMSKYPIMQKEWVEIMPNDPSGFKGNNLPVVNITWFEAIDYCNKRSKKEGLAVVYKEVKAGIVADEGANGYRLPTEAEWEYACRAGTITPFSTGKNITTEQANYNGDYPYKNNQKGQNLQKTTPVDRFAPNAWGLCGMHGNVWEWCWDWFGDYVNNTFPQDRRILRGGSWACHGEDLRSAFRSSYSPAGGFSDIGFRVVRSL